MEKNTTSVFATLNAVNCNEHTEKKNGLTYLSWAWAWGIAKSYYPDANYTIYENPQGWNYFTDGRTAWVKTGVTIQGQEHIDCLPVMNVRNQSIPLENVTSFDVNKAIQRSLTKALARHGLGLYIYAGEDLPDSADEENREAVKQARKRTAQPRLTKEQFYKMVRLHATGERAKDGGDIRSAWIKECNPSQSEIDDFDMLVMDYKSGEINQDQA